MRSRFTALSARSTPEPMPLSWTSKTLTYVNPSRSRSSRSSRLYDRTPMYTTCSTPMWSAIRRAEHAWDHLSERYESRKSRWASIPITPTSFGNARTTAGARLCSPKDVGVIGIDAHLDFRDSYLSRSEEHTSELQSRENLVCRL